MPNVLITGGSTGIGKAIAHQFIAGGYDLCLASRSLKDLEQLKKELTGTHPERNVDVLAVDLKKRNEVQKLSDFVTTKYSALDILINNAGTFTPGRIQDEPEGQLEDMMQLNLYCAYHLTRGLLPSIRRSKSGHIFNTCSVASLKAYPAGGSYSISKYAMLGFSDNLRMELMEERIKVTAVFPGATLTRSWQDDPTLKDRIMEAGDVAKMIWAASQLSHQACVEHITLRPQLGDL